MCQQRIQRTQVAITLNFDLVSKIKVGLEVIYSPYNKGPGNTKHSILKQSHIYPWPWHWKSIEFYNYPLL